MYKFCRLIFMVGFLDVSQFHKKDIFYFALDTIYGEKVGIYHISELQKELKLLDVWATSTKCKRTTDIPKNRWEFWLQKVRSDIECEKHKMKNSKFLK